MTAFSFFGRESMIHHSCDRCKKLIDREHEIRYVVNLEIQVAVEPCDGEFCDESNLAELEEILKQLDHCDCDEIRSNAYQCRQYDLCADCRNEYLADPFASERQPEFGFSDN